MEKSPLGKARAQRTTRAPWPEGAGRAALTSVSCSFNLKVWRPSRNTSGYAGTCRNMRSVTMAGEGRLGEWES